MKIIIVSGGFDPLHSGHINYIKYAKKEGDKLVVLLNSDDWLINKKGKFFMPFTERKKILEGLKDVDEVYDFEDDSIGSCINGLQKLKKIYPNEKLFFANGGDREKKNIPEILVKNVKFLFGVGGNEKINSSSWILKKWNYSSEERIWGKFYNLFEDDNCKVKELIVKPGKGMSFQKHFKRSEIWLVSKGSCVVNYSKDNPNKRDSITLNKYDQYNVALGDWHQITNPFKEDCHIIEIQYGEACIEDDIERIEYYEET